MMASSSAITTRIVTNGVLSMAVSASGRDEVNRILPRRGCGASGWAQRVEQLVLPLFQFGDGGDHVLPMRGHRVGVGLRLA